jgi:hypothetical protein
MLMLSKTRRTRPWAGRRLVLSLVAVLAASCLAFSSAASAAAPDKPQAKHHKKKTKPRPAYWGAWIGSQLTGSEPPWDMHPVNVFQEMVSKGLSLVAVSSPFAACPPSEECSFFPFPVEAMNNIRNYGAIPFFNWASQSTSPEPNLTTHMPDFQLADILSGKYDEYIQQFATAAANWGHPFFLRFNWEMNGNWFPWSENVNGNRPGESIAVWQHVHDIFTSVGATNATWVWCPYVDGYRKMQPFAQVYPGDSYVDWTCLDGFNWASNPTNPHPWKTFDQIFDSSYKRIVKKIAPGKPMVLAEMASTGGHRAKAKWIRDMFKQLATKYRRIRGLIWFDQIDRGINWPLETSPAATMAFAEGLRGKAFKSNIFAGATARPIPAPR